MENCSHFTAITFSIGSVLDEAQGSHNGNNYVFDKSGSWGRLVLVFQWMVVAYTLSISYKAVLRPIMMKIEYEDTIDTLDDMLESGMKLLLAGDSQLPFFMEADPRAQVKELLNTNRVEYFIFGTTVPKWVDEG